MAKVFTIGKYQIHVREKLTWRVYREADRRQLQEFGKIGASLEDKELKAASLEFGADIMAKVEDYFVPLMIQKVVTGDDTVVEDQEGINEIIDELDADQFEPIFNYCVKVYNDTREKMQSGKKKK